MLVMVGLFRLVRIGLVMRCLLECVVRFLRLWLGMLWKKLMGRLWESGVVESDE